MIRVLRGTGATHRSAASPFSALLFDSVRSSVFPGVAVGRVDLAQVRQAGGGVWSRKDLLPSLRQLGVWLQRGSVCSDGHCREAGGPTGAELTGLALGESLAYCSVSGEPLRSFH